MRFSPSLEMPIPPYPDSLTFALFYDGNLRIILRLQAWLPGAMEGPLRYTVSMSASMAVLNMAPVFGLDGHPALEAIARSLSRRRRRWKTSSELVSSMTLTESDRTATRSVVSRSRHVELSKAAALMIYDHDVLWRPALMPAWSCPPVFRCCSGAYTFHRHAVLTDAMMQCYRLLMMISPSPLLTMPGHTWWPILSPFAAGNLKDRQRHDSTSRSGYSHESFTGRLLPYGPVSCPCTWITCPWMQYLKTSRAHQHH